MSESARERVRIAVEALKYGKKPSRAKHKDGNIALIVPDLENPLFSLLVKGVRSVAIYVPSTESRSHIKQIVPTVVAQELLSTWRAS